MPSKKMILLKAFCIGIPLYVLLLPLLIEITQSIWFVSIACIFPVWLTYWKFCVWYDEVEGADSIEPNKVSAVTLGVAAGFFCMVAIVYLLGFEFQSATVRTLTGLATCTFFGWLIYDEHQSRDKRKGRDK